MWLDTVPGGADYPGVVKVEARHGLGASRRTVLNLEG